MTKNLLVEQCIEDILRLRLSHPSQLKNVVFVFPRVRFDGDAEWSSYTQMALLGAIQKFEPSELKSHPIFVPICGIVEVETISFYFRLQKACPVRSFFNPTTKKHVLVFTYRQRHHPWFIPGISEEEDSFRIKRPIESGNDFQDSLLCCSWPFS